MSTANDADVAFESLVKTRYKSLTGKLRLTTEKKQLTVCAVLDNQMHIHQRAIETVERCNRRAILLSFDDAPTKRVDDGGLIRLTRASAKRSINYNAAKIRLEIISEKSHEEKKNQTNCVANLRQ
jgi:hypothetical protein